jgi:hypothetical protein
MLIRYQKNIPVKIRLIRVIRVQKNTSAGGVIIKSEIVPDMKKKARLTQLVKAVFSAKYKII